MAESLFFAGADAKISVQPQASFGGAVEGSALTLAVVHDWSFKVSAEHKELRGMDTIFRMGVARCRLKIEGSLNYAKFDPTVTTWWLATVLNPDLETPDGTTGDTSRNKYFQIVGNIKPFTPGAANLRVTITDVYFKEVPIGLQANEWVSLNLSWVGRDLTWSNPT